MNLPVHSAGGFYLYLSLLAPSLLTFLSVR